MMRILDYKIHLACLAIISAACLFSVNEKGLQKLSQEQRGLEVRNLPSGRSIEDGTIFAVINTPKCGTGSLQMSFGKSLSCPGRDKEVEDSAIYTECSHGGTIIRTHEIDSAVRSLEKYRPDPRLQKCVIVTAMRNPQTWVPSVFMQKRQDLCDADISYEDFYNEYHNFIIRNQHFSNMANVVRPYLFEEFGTNMRSAAEEARRNGGYALYNTFGKTSGPFQNCELLFLDLDEHDNWTEIFAALYPGVTYAINQKRTDLCPKIAGHYEGLLHHELTREEIANIIKGDRDVRDYVGAYGMQD